MEFKNNILLFQQLCLDIASALHFIEGKNLFHLDIKPSNILYDEVKKIFLISDFGTASFYFDKQGTKSFTLKGYTPIYTSPEVLNYLLGGIKIYYPGKCDIFSLGVSLLQSYLGIKNA